MTAITILAYGALIFIILHALRYLLVMLQLMGITLKTPAVKLLERSQIPAHLLDLFAAREKELEELGFRFSCAFTVDEMISAPANQTHGLQYYHPEKKSYANLSESLEADVLTPCSVTFISILRDGRRLETVNGKKHMIVGHIPRTSTGDPYAETTRKHWEFHLMRLSILSPDVFRPFGGTLEEKEKNLAESNVIFMEYIASLQTQGIVRPEGGGLYRFRAWAALKLTGQILGGYAKAQSLRKRIGAASRGISVPVELEMSNYLRQRYLIEQKRRRSWTKLLMTVVTLAFFVLAFKLILHMEWFSLLVILGVLLLHEGGHLLAMFLAGYKNLSMFFIPLMGAVAMGSEARIAAHKKVIAFFAGPVPGIILALLLLSLKGDWQSLAMSSPRLFTVILFLLVINYFNLIPILPLDGGQLFNTIIFSRFRLLQILFILGSTAGLVLLGLLLKTPMLLALAIIIPFGFWYQYLQQKYLFLMRQRFPNREEVPEEELIRHSFQLLREGPAARMPFAKKFHIVKHIENQYYTRPASATTVTLTLALYAALIAWPVITFVLPAAREGLFLGRSSNPCTRIHQARPTEGFDATLQGRFQRLDRKPENDPQPRLLRFCFLEQGHWQEISASHFLAKLWTLYGKPDMGKNGFYYTIRDRESGMLFWATIANMNTGYDAPSDKKSLRAIHRFEQLLEKTALADCSLEIDVFYPPDEGEPTPGERGSLRFRIGARQGKPFSELAVPLSPPPASSSEDRKPAI